MQRVFLKEVLNHTILNKRNKCYLRSNLLLFYVKRKKGIRKNRIIKAIYLGLSLFKRQKELLIAASIDTVRTNKNGATIDGALSIDNHLQKQQHLAKSSW